MFKHAVRIRIDCDGEGCRQAIGIDVDSTGVWEYSSSHNLSVDKDSYPRSVQLYMNYLKIHSVNKKGWKISSSRHLCSECKQKWLEDFISKNEDKKTDLFGDVLPLHDYDKETETIQNESQYNTAEWQTAWDNRHDPDYIPKDDRNVEVAGAGGGKS